MRPDPGVPPSEGAGQSSPRVARLDAENHARHTGLPLPPLRFSPTRTATRYAVTSVDRDGRLADRSVLRFMAWPAGSQLDLAVEDRWIVVAGRGGDTRINERGFLRLPLHLRRRCAIEPGDQVLMIGDRRSAELLLIPVIAVGEILHAYRRRSGGEAR